MTLLPHIPLSLRRSVWVFVLLLLSAGPAFSQGLQSPSPNTAVEKIRLGPHPEYTRILIDLNQPAPYKVTADFSRKKITLTFANAALNPQLRSRSIEDKNLEKITLHPGNRALEIILHLRNANTWFFHSLNAEKSQIVVDISGQKKPVRQIQIGQKDTRPAPKIDTPAPARKMAPNSREVSRAKQQVRVAGMTPGKIQELRRNDIEEKLKNGWDNYQAALKTFQAKNYPEAIEAFATFAKEFPDSIYLDHILFLIGEAKFQIAFREPHPIYEDALEAYKKALRRFPNSKFASHARDKLGFIFSEMGYILEAKTLYEQALSNEPESPYTLTRKNSLATMMLREGKYDEAYAAFQRLLENQPKNIAARASIFEIARYFYEQKNYAKALEVYEDGISRWPNELNERPEINFNIGDIYYRNKNYAKARTYFFNLVNLAPGHPLGHKILNRIGDSYLLEGNHLNALAVFDESSRRNTDNPESQYGKIRMADIGIINPQLTIKEVAFNSDPYYQPFKTYDEIFNSAKDVDILAEVTLSRGIAFLKEQSYLKAIQEFKKLLPLGPDSPFHDKTRKYIQQALVFLVDKYSRQGGVLPILYSYSDFVSLSLGDVKNLTTMIQIGEAYQSIGMFPQALRFYEQVKKLDSKGLYRDRIFLDLGRIHLEEKNFKEAELVARSFLKSYPQSPQVPDALKLLASSHSARQQYKESLKVYDELLSRHKENISETHYLIAETHINLNDPASAVNEYRKTIDTFDRKAKIIPDYIRKAYYNLGIALFQTRKYAEAAEALQAARQLFPEQPLKDWADYLLMESYENLKNTPKTTAALNTLIQSENSDNLLRQAAESKLKVLDWEKKFKDNL